MEKITLALFIVTLTLFNTSNGQVAFQENIITDVTYSVDAGRFVYAADLDNDGDMDILSASNLDNKIAWYENMDGQGNFSKQKIVNNNADGAFTVYAFDLDRDSDLDIIAASFQDRRITWYENDGDGNFSSLQILNANLTGSATLGIADIDNDNDLDVIYASFAGDLIDWLVNDGSGNFSPNGNLIEIASDADKATNVQTADVNNDGFLDVVVALNDENAVAWYENIDGINSFGPKQIIASNVIDAFYTYVADIDNDGDIDVISAAQGDNTVAWYENIDGQGNFGTKQIINDNADYASSVYAIDLDNDGDMDVLSASVDDNKIAWYENIDGQGNFSAEQIISDSTAGHSVYATDIDNDGDMDVLSAGIDDEISLFRNLDGQGDFGLQEIISSGTDVPSSAHAADVDNDGDMDLFTTSFDEKISWFENLDGQGTYSNQRVIATLNSDPNPNPKAVQTGDIDNDGDLDFAAVQRGSITWYENTNGQGDFILAQTINDDIPEANDARSVVVTDVDNDGDLDVISSSANTAVVAWFRNTDGQGTFEFGDWVAFSNGNPEESVQEPEFIFAADLDNDGDIDVVTASKFDDKIVWSENDGSGNFGTIQNINTNANGAESVFAADLDNDGDIDVVSASFFDNTIGWYENTDGQGNFGSIQVISNNANGAEFVFGTDLDNDGDVDIISASNDDNKIAWYENTDGQGTFSSEIIVSTDAGGAQFVTAADINGDGATDIISVSNLNDRVAWYMNSNSTLSIDDILTNNNDVILFPNPVTNVLNFKINTIIDRVDVVNLLGQNVTTFHKTNIINNSIDLSTLSKGLYIIKIITGSRIKSFKINKN